MAVTSEYYQGLLGSFGLLITLVFSIFWWLGGRPGGRVFRRWIAPLVFAGGVCGLAVLAETFRWWFLFSLLAYKGVTHIGYGGDSLVEKLWRRGLWSLLMTACALTFACWTGAWTLYVVQVVVGLTAAIVIGIRNPVVASQEEGLICFSNAFLVPFMVL
jgi:hypothetical protein